jgi:hypothetical protein
MSGFILRIKATDKSVREIMVDGAKYNAANPMIQNADVVEVQLRIMLIGSR